MGTDENGELLLNDVIRRKWEKVVSAAKSGDKESARLVELLDRWGEECIEEEYDTGDEDDATAEIEELRSLVLKDKFWAMTACGVKKKMGML